MTMSSFLSQCENLDILPAGIIILESDYTVICWNRTMEEWTGIPREKVLGRDLRDLYPHLSDRKYALRIGQVFEGGAAAFFSTQFHPHFIPAPLPGGGLRFQRTTVHSVPEGNKTYALVFIDDVTELVQQVRAYREMRDRALREVRERLEKEAALEESEAKFREIFESANDAIHIHELREDGLPGRFIEVNAVACKMLGYSREEFLAMTPLDLVRGGHSRPLDVIGREILEKGYAIFETEHRRKDGGTVPVEIHAHRVIIRNREVVLSVVRDITERRRNQAALLALTTELQTIFDNAPAMIWYKDTENRFIRVNPAAAASIGLPREEIEGKSAYDLFPELAEKYYRDDLEVISTKKPKLGIIEQMQTRNGGTRWVETHKVPLLDLEGNVSGILLFVNDITERKMAEDALALANRKLHLLSSITRHDLLNQVSALKWYIELARDEKELTTIREFLDKMKKVLDTAEEQITFTRDYQEIGVREPSWQNVADIAARIREGFPPSGVDILLEVDDIEVYADPLFEKVIFNLFENSFRYGGPSLSRIRVSAGEEQGGLVIAVEDNGVGIPEEDKKYLFRKGFGKHTGLGLFLSREILAITGLSIRETGVPGKGARFEIFVPEGKFRRLTRERTGEKG